ncbi:MAG: hypothetical protein KDA85_07140 [Planctomycetaceae bacterium]|nr:hypothetical protein [Planctomycetaceae bacterium]
MNPDFHSPHDWTELEQVTQYLQAMPIPECPLPCVRVDTAAISSSQSPGDNTRTRPLVVTAAILLTGLMALTLVIQRDSRNSAALITEQDVLPVGLTSRSPILVEEVDTRSSPDAGVRQIQQLRSTLASLRTQAERQRAASQLNELRRRLNDESLAAK